MNKMQREIKFRGKKNSTKEWIYGSLLTDKDGGYAIVQITDNPIFNGVVNGWCFGIEDGSECQYTGLEDKNGKEVYEGDKVVYTLNHDSGQNEIEAVVEWHNHAWRLNRIWLLTEIRTIEVVGSVF